MRKLLNMELVLIVILFLALPGNGFGEEYQEKKILKEQAKKEDAQKLEKIVVEERRIEESIAAESIAAPKLKEIGHNVDIITGKEIEEAGFVDIVEALKAMVPGFYSSARSGRAGWKSTYMHGSNEILWLLDGVRVNRMGRTGYAMTLGAHMIDRVEVLKGGESLFYGSDARAGAINIITKKITKETSGEFGLTYGDDEYREVFGHVTDTIKGHGFMAFGSYDASDGYKACDDQSYDDALNPYENRQFGFYRSTIGVKYRKEFDMAGKAVLSGKFQEQEGFFDYPYPQFTFMTLDWEDKMGTLKWDHDINDTFSYSIKSYYHKWWGKVDLMKLDSTYNYDAVGNSWGVPGWGSEESGVNLTTSTRWGEGHEIVSGIDYHNYEVLEQFIDRSADVMGLFGQYRPYLPFSPDTRLAMGARYEKVEEESVIWDVSMKTPIVGQTYLRGIVGTSFSLPTPTQLYEDDPENNTFGNPDLTPEESFNVEVGIGGSWRYFQCDVGYFYQEIEDMIASVTLDNGDKTYENVDGTTEIDGVEISAGIGPFSGISFNTSATWVDAKDKETGEQLETIPEFYAKANLGYRHPTGRFGTNLMANYTGNMYERGLGDPDEVNYGNYCVVDASAFVRFGRELKHKITCRVENILDKEYATHYYRTSNIAGDYFVYNQYGSPISVVVGYIYTF